MLLKLGVDISRLVKPLRNALNYIDHIFLSAGTEAVVTSTFEGSHKPGSLHYSNAALDLRLPGPGREYLFGLLKDNLGNDFDIILEKDHIHVEHDPKFK
jgi:hypothetical protein